MMLCLHPTLQPGFGHVDAVAGLQLDIPDFAVLDILEVDFDYLYLVPVLANDARSIGRCKLSKPPAMIQAFMAVRPDW